MLKIGLTGGIGTGKTTVANIFKCLGIPVLNADVVARNIMLTNEPVKQAIVAAFGAEAYENGQLNNKLIAQIVFKDAYQLAVLNAIVHPAAINFAHEWANEQNSSYVVKEAALFFESGSAEGIDFMIGVTAPEALRVKRVIERDGVSREQVLARMNQQIDEGLKMKLCDFVIQNNEQKLLIPQVLAIHEKLLDST